MAPGVFSVGVVLLLTSVVQPGAADPTVKTNVGTIIGVVKETKFANVSKPVTQFLGIPFAESPTGQLRFSKPVPKAPFSDPYNASAHGPACPQNMFFNPDQNLTKHIQEDCLNLNIFVPGDMTSRKIRANVLPVMIWIYGGGFRVGASDYYDGSIISSFNDVIVVTINYRLSVFGFLSTGDENSPGNYGLWDQHLAIKWVNDNIAPFGGDVNKITIAGESAGSASVFFQATYPGNKGMFQRIIGESGVTMAPWAFTENEEALQHNLAYFSQHANCPLDDKSAFMACLRNKSVEEIMASLQVTEKVIELAIRFPPVVDGDFITKSPRTLFDGPNSDPALDMFRSVDILTGVNSMDGSVYMMGLWKFVIEAITHMSLDQGCPRQVFEEVIVPHVTQDLFNTDNAAADEAIIFEYTDWSDPNNGNKTRGNLMNMSSDFTFFTTGIKTINKHVDLNAGRSDATSTYFYKFSQRPSYDTYPAWVTGASHADELGFVFGFPLGLSRAGGIPVVTPPTPEEIDLSSDMMVYWTNFMTSGDPNFPVKITDVKWPQYDNVTQSYIEFTNHLSAASVKSKLIPQRNAFWEYYLPEILRDT